MNQRPSHKIAEVDKNLLEGVAKSPATAYCIAMQFQLGCAIGELIGMGVRPENLLQTIDQMVDQAIQTRTPQPETGG